MDLKDNLTQISLKWGYKMEEISPGIFGMDISLKRKEGNIRYQYITVRLEQIESGEQRVYINSKIGINNGSISYYDLLKETLWCNYCTIAILATKDKEGNPNESLIVQSAPIAAHTNKELLDVIIFEVANNADFLEEKYFGGDNF